MDGTAPRICDCRSLRGIFLLRSQLRLFDSAFAAGRTSLGGANFTSMVLRGRIAGFQFHPERSGRAGLALLSEAADFIRKEVP